MNCEWNCGCQVQAILKLQEHGLDKKWGKIGYGVSVDVTIIVGILCASFVDRTDWRFLAVVSMTS